MDQHSDIWGNRSLTLNRLVGAVGETSAIGVVGLLRDTVEEYFPLGVGVRDVDIENKTGSYTRKSSLGVCEFHLEERAGQLEHTDICGQIGKERTSS